MLKKTLSITAIVAAFAVPALAADLPVANQAQTAAPLADTQVDDTDLSGLTGFATDFSTPEKKLFNKGQQVGVESQLINDNNKLILYPQVSAKNTAAQTAINTTVKNFVDQVQKLDGKVLSTYDIKADGNGIFSYVVYYSSSKDGQVGSHPTVKGFTFDTKTGQQLDMAHFGTFSVAAVNQGLKMDGYMKDKITAELTQMPSEFFVDQSKTVYSIVPEGVAAAASEGTLYVPVGKAK